MSSLYELSAAVRVRRADMGLTQMTLATLSGLSRATVNQVENGTIKDLSMTRAARLLDALGLSMSIAAPRTGNRKRLMEKSKPLDIAARTASVSYKIPVSAGQLRETLTTGMFLPDFLPHVYALLDEAPVSLLASVVEQVHEEAGIERAAVWTRMRELADRLKSRREIWQ
ncbi:MAG: helix-turn-helix domain-containing protein [Pseudomonadota bacterium]